MLAKKYKSEVVSVINPIEGIYTLEIKSLGRKFKFQPGQFLHLSLDNTYDGIGQWPDSRCFSMRSNPTEENIKITYAVKGRFTKKMMEVLKVGSEIWLKLPYGDLFAQKHNKNNTVFIAGGTGITPFLSLFTHLSFNEYINPKIYLGFRSKSYNNYKDELGRSSNLTKYVKIFYEDDDGIIDINKIFYENCSTSNYFISGPPIMINIFMKELIFNGVPKENILTDDWE
ncbi:MAG: FAD-dependent oxidoreductase [Bacteroidetes bacterium]|nr:FAD-dependent oxidoreductase [Bacteroidota bacterium]